MLRALGVGHRYGDRRLFSSVDLVMGAGDVVFVVGPSGTGKSTLLLVLGGLLAPTDGTVITVEPREVAWVLQDLDGLQRRSVIDNAQLYSRIDGGPRRSAHAAATKALGGVGLADLATARASTLSGGENQRLCVARALASRRPVLLADEPTSQLDRTNACVVMNALHKHAARDRCVVVVTHDIDAIPAGARVVELRVNGLHDRTPSSTPP